LSEKYAIIFPVVDEYGWLVDYIKNPDITVVKKSNFPFNYDRFDRDSEYLPIRYATQHLHGLSPTDYSHDHTVMVDKYLWMGYDPKSWIDFNFHYNVDKENELFTKLGLKEGSDYVVVNGNGGSDAVGKESLSIQIDSDNIVEMTYVEGFTLMDWRKVIMHCKELHTISTSLVYLADQWCNETCELNVYKRNNNPNTLYTIQPIMTRNWNYVF
jgi:hypothetical protein